MAGGPRTWFSAEAEVPTVEDSEPEPIATSLFSGVAEPGIGMANSPDMLIADWSGPRRYAILLSRVVTGLGAVLVVGPEPFIFTKIAFATTTMLDVT